MHRRGFSALLVCFVIVLPPLKGQTERMTDLLVAAINKNDTLALSHCLGAIDINDTCGGSGHTPLVWAVLLNKPRMAEYLLAQKADPDLQCHNHAPLQIAAHESHQKILNLLLAAGANPNITDSSGNTPLIMAASQKKIKIVKALVRAGAWVNFKNQYLFSPITIAQLSENPRIASYLKTYYEINLPSWTDGPHVHWTTQHRIRIEYFVHDSLARSTRRIVSRHKVDALPYTFKGHGNDSLAYTVYRNYAPKPDRYSRENPLLILGDVHGDYSKFSAYLQAQGVMDKKQNWIWNNGSLFLLGDIFDRGAQVTECLWLINKLQHQSEKAGGSVHLILGNHEIMELKGDHRYLNEKYSYLCQKTQRNYSDNFGPHTEMGRWIRSFNTMEIIDSILFVHAGLHPYLGESGISQEQVNSIVRTVMNTRKDRQLPPIYHWLVSESGPLWYRGYFKRSYTEDPLPEDKLIELLQHFGVKKVFIGHTNVQDITALYGGKVIAMDIPYYLGKGEPAGMLIEDGKLFIARLDGSRSLFQPSGERPK